MQFIFAPILGNLSDRYGRRPILLISLFGLGVDFLLSALAPTLAWLFVGRGLAGLCGASFTTASAYIADVSPPEKRAQNFGLVGAAFGLGFIIGPALGSALALLGTRAPFYGAAALSLLNFIYGYFVLPESLPKENRRKFDWKRANPFGSLKQLFRHQEVNGLIIAVFLLYLSGQVMPAVWSYFTMDQFNWSEGWVGFSLTVVGILVAVVQGGLIRFISPKLGARKSIFYGFILYIASFVLFSVAPQGWMMFAIMVPYCLAGISGPSLQSVISSRVAANEQGEMQGALTSLMSATSIIGPFLMPWLFHLFSKADAPIYFPGAPFLAGGVLTFMGLLFSLVSLRKLPKKEDVPLDEGVTTNVH
jgi:DHA1 family tetracycline resistance protein-like MFS transporter